MVKITQLRKRPLTPNDLDSLTPQELDQYLIQREKAQLAFQKWMIDKYTKELDLKEKLREEKELDLIKTQKYILKKKELKVKTEEKLKEWRKTKDAQNALKKMKEREAEEENQKLKSLKKAKGEEAFSKWKSSIRHRDNQPHPYPHQTSWKAIEIPETIPSKSIENLKSPPALYNEYELYREKAPKFLIKYKNHVASGK